MNDTIDYYFWISSDWAWFGNERLRDMARRYGLRINYYPVDMTSVYQRTGGVKLDLRSQERKDYRIAEMKRYSRILGMPIVLKPSYRIQTGALPSRVVIAAQAMGLDEHDLTHAIMGARWSEDRNIEDAETLRTICMEQGLDGDALLALAQDPSTEVTYYDYTNAAVRRGMFGSPFYFYGEHRFWGQDRLEMLDATIRAERDDAQPPL